MQELLQAFVPGWAKRSMCWVALLLELAHAWCNYSEMPRRGPSQCANAHGHGNADKDKAYNSNNGHPTCMLAPNLSSLLELLSWLNLCIPLKDEFTPSGRQVSMGLTSGVSSLRDDIINAEGTTKKVMLVHVGDWLVLLQSLSNRERPS